MKVLLAGCGIPVAWSIVRATEPGSWKPHWLYECIQNVGWHPFLRINHQGSYRLRDQNTWQPLAKLVKCSGQSWSGRVVCFKTRPLACTLLARWEPDNKDPWLVVTDLEPDRADILWYGLRSSTECVYRDEISNLMAGNGIVPVYSTPNGPNVSGWYPLDGYSWGSY